MKIPLYIHQLDLSSRDFKFLLQNHLGTNTVKYSDKQVSDIVKRIEPIIHIRNIFWREDSQEPSLKILRFFRKYKIQISFINGHELEADLRLLKILSPPLLEYVNSCEKIDL